MPATLTIHSVDPSLSKRLLSLAKREKKSVNQTVKDVLASYFGLQAGKRPAPRNDIMRFCGILTPADAEVLHAALKPFDRIDPDDWK